MCVTKKEHFSRRFPLNPLKPHLNSLNSPSRPCETPQIMSAEGGKRTWNMPNILHQQDFQLCQFYLRKTRQSQHFWPKIENGRCFSHLVWKNCQFSCNYLLTQIQTHSIFFCENSSLNSANFPERVIFCLNSWKFYPCPKIFVIRSMSGGKRGIENATKSTRLNCMLAPQSQPLGLACRLWPSDNDDDDFANLF